MKGTRLFALKSAALLTVGVVCLWAPHTAFYQFYGENSWVFVLVAFSGCVSGLFLARTLWQWAEAWAEHNADRWAAPLPAEDTSNTPAPTWLRWTLLASILVGACVLLWGIERNTAAQHTNNLQSIASTAGSLVLGILAGRWLLMQAHASQQKKPSNAPPLQLPAWTKWLTGGLLLVAALFAGFGGYISHSSSTEGAGFLYSGTAFGVSIFGALWVARRFEEQEETLKQKARAQTKPETPQKTP
jgi:hypothetical protein